MSTKDNTPKLKMTYSYELEIKFDKLPKICKLNTDKQKKFMMIVVTL